MITFEYSVQLRRPVNAVYNPCRPRPLRENIVVTASHDQIHELEKRYACTVYKCDYGSDATPGAALCVELVDWRSHRKVKLRFRVAPSHACFVGEPEVEVRDIYNETCPFGSSIRSRYCAPLFSDPSFFLSLLYPKV